jgi:hypothetical protein
MGIPMTDHDIDVLATAQNACERLWPMLARLRPGDVQMLCKLRHLLEHQDYFVPNPLVLGWLLNLIEENKADEKRIKDRTVWDTHFYDWGRVPESGSDPTGCLAPEQ